MIRVLRIVHLNGLYNRGNLLCSSTATISLLFPSKDILSLSIHLQGRGLKKWLSPDLHLFQHGQSVQLWIPRVQPLGSHPFTVAAAQRDEKDGIHLQLYAKIHKGVTKRLLDRVEKCGGQCQLNVLVEGFYGQHRQVSRRGSQTLFGRLSTERDLQHCLHIGIGCQQPGTRCRWYWCHSLSILLARSNR
jgi:hypothetical protein